MLSEEDGTNDSGENLAPLAMDDVGAGDEDGALTIDVLANDIDPELDPLTVVEVTQGENGSVVINDDSTVTYTPIADWNGTDSFTYTVSDGNGNMGTATVAVTVHPVEDVPVAMSAFLELPFPCCFLMLTTIPHLKPRPIGTPWRGMRFEKYSSCSLLR